MNVNAIIIRNARVALGLSLREVAKRSDVEIVELGRIERGVSEGEPDELLRIFQVLTAATAERRPAPRPLPLERAQLAEHCYETYCAAFMQQKTLRPRHPGQMPLASWHDQREEIRACWRAVVEVLMAPPPPCGREIEVERPSGIYRTHCVLPEGHRERAAARGEVSPCGAFFVVEPPIERTIK